MNQGGVETRAFSGSSLEELSMLYACISMSAAEASPHPRRSDESSRGKKKSIFGWGGTDAFWTGPTRRGKPERRDDWIASEYYNWIGRAKRQGAPRFETSTSSENATGRSHVRKQLRLSLVGSGGT
jgi:hypothetical protein